MARRKNAMMKFVVPTAIALGKRAVTRWPMFAAALGGALAYGMWSRRQTRALGTSTAATWTAKDARKSDSVEPMVTSPLSTSSVDAWSPTAPNAAW